MSKKENKHLKKGSSTALMLQEIADEMDYWMSGLERPALVLKYGQDFKEALNAKERANRQRSLRRLKHQRLIQERKTAKKYEITLSEAGVRELFRLRVLNADRLLDEKVCMVIFDIPESQRKLRRRLRKFLKQAGFISIQRSVWITPFDVAGPLSDLFRINKSEKWVRIFNAVEFK